MNFLICYLSLTHFSILISVKCYVDNVESENLPVKDIAGTIVEVIGADANTKRIRELKEKLKKVDTYVVDKNKYAELLKNITIETDLNATNFFSALYERDYLKIVSGNVTKSVYLQLKEKMNRDDVIKILAEKGNTSNLVKSARKAIGIDDIEFNDQDDDDIILDNRVDEILAQAPSDNHRFDHNDNDGMYWGKTLSYNSEHLFRFDVPSQMECVLSLALQINFIKTNLQPHSFYTSLYSFTWFS